MGEIFFDKDPLTGKRRPSSVFWAVALAVAVILVMSIVTWTAYRNRPRLVPTTLVPLATSTFTPEPTDTPTPTATWTPAPTEDPWAVKRQELLRRINECEKDPANWTLEELPDTYKAWYRISEPDCVVDGLARTVAWYMLVYAGGYTFEEAAEALGFDRFPIMYPAAGTRFPFKTPKGVWQAANTNLPYYPGMRMWLTNEKGEPALPIFYPKGCYYARHLQGGIWRDWREWYGAPFLVQCYIAADTWRYQMVVQADDRTVVFDFENFEDLNVATKIRHVYIYAYDLERGWYLLGGYITDDRFSITPEELNISSWPLTSEHQRVIREWGRQGVVWSPQWLKETWGLEPHSLPDLTEAEVLTSKKEWKAFWKTILPYFKGKWPERTQYYWAFKEPPKR